MLDAGCCRSASNPVKTGVKCSFRLLEKAAKILRFTPAFDDVSAICTSESPVQGADDVCKSRRYSLRSVQQTARPSHQVSRLSLTQLHLRLPKHPAKHVAFWPAECRTSHAFNFANRLHRSQRRNNKPQLASAMNHSCGRVSCSWTTHAPTRGSQ